MNTKPEICYQYALPKGVTVTPVNLEEVLAKARKKVFIPTDIRKCPKKDCGFFTRSVSRTRCPHDKSILVTPDEDEEE